MGYLLLKVKITKPHTRNNLHWHWVLKYSWNLYTSLQELSGRRQRPVLQAQKIQERLHKPRLTPRSPQDLLNHQQQLSSPWKQQKIESTYLNNLHDKFPPPSLRIDLWETTETCNYASKILKYMGTTSMHTNLPCPLKSISFIQGPPKISLCRKKEEYLTSWF